jgi:FKBP-type peptidyl-prolyl cis-trans isomerase FkpA
MSTTRKRDRIVAMSMAIFFFVLASALTIAVIYQTITTKNNNNSQSTPPTAASTAPKTTLEGTKLSGFTPTTDVTSLKSTDIKVGTGAEAQPGDTVTVDYTGAVASTGIIFQSTKDSGQPAQLGLNNVIEGWKLGIPGMKVGGTRQLLIPANEAYGASPPSGSGIPANAALVFNVTLDKVGS